MKAPPERWPHAQAWVGQGVAAIDTPSLVIDLDAMERNLARMAAFARERGLRLRPHAKLHKSAELSRLQMAQGAVGVCVQKTEEALRLAAAGVGDIFISNEVIAPAKLARLASAVRERTTRFAIAVDCAEGIDRLAAALHGAGVTEAAAIDVFVEIDVGQGRCGVAPGEAALALVRRIHQHPALRWAGLQAYHGGAQHRRGAAERAETIAASAQAVRHTLDALRQQGFEAPLVTGAGTGSLVHEAASGLWGELQAGSYLFMDADYAANERDAASPVFEHALFVKSQVMSCSADRAICDAGHKSHAIDSGLPQVAHPAGLVFANGGDEHGVLRTAAAGAPLPALGDTVWLIPGHCDPTVNLHDFFVGVRGGLSDGRVERLITIDTRGALT
ncbi:MAG: DSD1 family PLP-dependent enzyme [Hydrogenophaga sp.]|uniref:DSD1 family PLP-dependent enzyme n=2 Tax=Hydrogenophaga sp. TaxID=1904254 RepID=UPI0025BBB932|nr:DSD1 family PLP-dependent enzyme [Hydrogenophaga sp.]MBT9549861.1 DSD1 family PLP-dependent enzyme [Hydrogenophaga sp.]